MYKTYKTSASYFSNSASDYRFYNEHANQIKNILAEASSEGRIDGTKIRDAWFPRGGEAQVFISHSHKDVDAAVELSNSLRSSFGIRSFIDSCVWLHADDLLREIDDKYCYNENSKTYSYQKRNGTTAHVHMMLATALSLMMDSCECVFFIESSNSVTRDEAIEKTGSPWIMYELNLLSLIRSNIPTRPISFSGRVLNEKEIRANASLNIDYTIDLSKPRHLSREEYSLWYRECRGSRGFEALDVLYELH